MALVEHCFCCGLPIACGFFAAYLLIAYLIAFAFELLWILESEAALPAAAVLLCAGYFTMALFAAVLIHGIATKNITCLIGWMFAITILAFPESGLVIYMSIQYWRIETIYGMTELACWLIRIIVSVIELILVQSLYTMWKDEDLLDKRLRDLNMAAVAIPPQQMGPLNSQFYHNNGYDHSMENVHNTNLKRFGSTPQIWHPSMPNNMMPFPLEGYQFYTTSEFNASIFMPSVVNSTNDLSGKKAQSLMDLRLLDEAYIPTRFGSAPWLAQSLTETSSAILPPSYGTTMSEIGGKSPRLTKFHSVDALNEINRGDGGGHIIRNRTGFYAQPVANYGVPIYYGPLDGPDFLIYRKQVDKLASKNSLSNTSDDVQKYRDVAL